MSKYHHKARNKGKKRAISPVIATVILIAITLIAAVAIGGFVFGLFGSFTSSAQVSVTGADITANAVASGNQNTYYCRTTTTSTLSNYAVLSNTGTSSASVTSVSIKVNGVNMPLTGLNATGACSVLAGKSLYLYQISISNSNGSVSSGTGYLLTVTLSNGGQVPYQGTFQ
ncbi:MAG: type IV pilin N-terminal domain-containing protein [Conexivisphaerales archaeon]